MEKLFTKFAVGFALILIVLELTYINSKSLLALSGDTSYIDRIFAIIGAMAFSAVTVIIMRKSDEKWLKIAFPIFDIALCFCGLNIHLAFEYRFALTIFMSLFAGLITYSLGKISRTERVYDSTLTQRVSPDELHVICLNSLKQEALLYIKKSDANLSAYEAQIIDMYQQVKAGIEFDYSNYLNLRRA